MKRVLTNIVGQIVTGVNEYRAEDLRDFLTNRDKYNFNSLGIVVTLRGDYMLDSDSYRIRNIISRKLNLFEHKLNSNSNNQRKKRTAQVKKLTLDVISKQLFEKGKLKQDEEIVFLKNPRFHIVNNKNIKFAELVDIDGKRTKIRLLDILKKY